MLRALYDLLGQRRLYYQLRSADGLRRNFSFRFGRFIGRAPELSFPEICSGFRYAVYVDSADPSAASQVDKWFSCGFFQKSDVLLILYSRRISARKRLLRFFAQRNVMALFQGAELTITTLRRQYRVFEPPYRINRYSRILAVPPLRDLLTFQYLIVATPK